MNLDRMHKKWLAWLDKKSKEEIAKQLTRLTKEKHDLSDDLDHKLDALGKKLSFINDKVQDVRLELLKIIYDIVSKDKKDLNLESIGKNILQVYDIIRKIQIEIEKI